MSAQTGMPADRQLLDDVASALIRRHSIVKDEFFCEATITRRREQDGETVWVPVIETIVANRGWEGRVEQIALAKVKTMGAETLARLIYAEPNADLYGVHCGTWLGKYESGPLLLQQIAATAIVCRIRAKLGVTSDVREHSEGVSA
jgi:hypothetical protein